MQAIEFEAHLNNGLIHLPLNYQHWQEGKPVKVIVLVEEKSNIKKSIHRHAGKIELTQDPLEFQSTIRDEWS